MTLLASRLCFLLLLTGKVERGLSVKVRKIEFGLLVEQVLNNKNVPVLGCQMQGGVLLLLCLLVYILAFADQDAHHVEIALFGRFPDDAESHLCLGLLAHIKRDFVLTIAGIPKFRVKISFPRKKFLNDPWEPIVGSVMKRRPASLITSVDVGSVGQEDGDALKRALFTGQVEGCAQELIGELELTAVLEQKLYYGHVVAH